MAPQGAQTLQVSASTPVVPPVTGYAQATTIIDDPPGVSAPTTAMTGGNGTFTFQVTDALGLSAVLWVNVDIGATPGVTPECMFTFWANAGALGLIDDSGAQWNWGTLSAPPIQNSSCRIEPDSSYNATTGILNVDITFLSQMQALETIWAIAADVYAEGDWAPTVSWNTPQRQPAISGLSPATVLVNQPVTMSGSNFTDEYGVCATPWMGSAANAANVTSCTASAIVFSFSSAMQGVACITSAGQQVCSTQQLSVAAGAPGPSPVITTPALSSALLGGEFSQTLTANGGAPPYHWSASAGSLPPGLSLSDEGALYGIPSQDGPYSPVVTVADSAGGHASATFSQTVIDSPPTVALVGTPAAGQGSGTFTFYVTSPAGLDDLTWINEVISTTLGGTQPQCSISFWPNLAGMALALIDNSGQWSWGTLASPPAASTSSYCSINPSPASNYQIIDGTTANLNLSITFLALQGTQSIWAIDSDNGVDSDWTGPSLWNIPAPPPAISGFSPASGAQGTTLTISGSNFGTTQGTVSIGGVQVASIASWSASAIVVTVPANGASGLVSVTAGGVTANSSGSFTFLPPSFTMSAPSVSSVTVTPTGATGSYSYNQTFQGLNGSGGPVGLTYRYNGGSLPSGLSFSLNSLTVLGPSPITASVTVSAAQGTAHGSYTISITATGTGSSGAAPPPSSVTVVVTPAPYFQISTPPEITVNTVAGTVTSTGFAQIITGYYGFSSPVTIRMLDYRVAQNPQLCGPEGAPAALSYQGSPWTPDAVTGIANVSGTLQAAPSAPTGVYYYDLVAQSGSLSYPFSIPVNIVSTSSQADFSLTPSSQNVTVTRGGAAFSFQETLSALNTPLNANWTGSFAIGTPPGWPSGVNVAQNNVAQSTFSSLPITATISITAFSSAATVANLPLTIAVAATDSQTGQQMNHSISITLTVSGAASFSLTASPSSQNANSQGMANYQVNVNGVNGFSQNVTLSASASSGYTATFAPSSVAGSGVTGMKVKGPPQVVAKPVPITVTGTGADGSSSSVGLTLNPNVVSNSGPGTIDYPPPLGSISVCDPVFVWDAGAGVTNYQLFLSTKPRGQGGQNLYTSPVLAQGTRSVYSSSLPKGGGTIYAWLVSQVGDGLEYDDTYYTSDCGNPGAGDYPQPTIAYASMSVSVLNDSQFWSPQDPQAYVYTTDQGDPQFFTSCYANRTGDPNDTTGNLYLGAFLVEVKDSRRFSVQYTAFDSVPAGYYPAVCQWESPENGEVYNVPLNGGVNVYDATPVITSATTDSVLYAGDTTEDVVLTITGHNFGASSQLVFCAHSSPPVACDPNTNDTSDIPFYIPLGGWSEDTITVMVGATANASGVYDVALISDGVGGSGFLGAPGGGQNKAQASGPSVASPQAVTVFLVHGIGQGSSDMVDFKNNLQQAVIALQATGQLKGVAFTFDASFDYSSCAANPVCPPNCTIENGANLLATTILSKPGSNVVVIGYSMGGLIARDMIANNRQGVAVQRKINALITLGTPNLGYPGSPLDQQLGPFANTACPLEMNEMTSDFRSVPQPQVLLSSYLSGLESKWSSIASVTPPTKPHFWLAESGALCSQAIRTGDATNTYGCPDYNKVSDGVVCDQSSQYKSGGPVQPDQKTGWDGFAHAHGVIMCNPSPGNPVTFPASFSAGDAPVLYNPPNTSLLFLGVLASITQHCCS